jgi:hypothetical protein
MLFEKQVKVEDIYKGSSLNLISLIAAVVCERRCRAHAHLKNSFNRQ